MSALRRCFALIGTALASAVLPAFAAAQSSATISIAAYVDTPLTGIAVANLDFGSSIIPGTNRTVTPGASAGCTGCVSGQWQVQKISNAGAANRKFVQLTFTTLPSSFTEVSSGATLAVTWTNAAQACLAKNGTEYYCYTAWTPVQNSMHSVQINPDPNGTNGTRDLNIYLGGTVAPGAGQRAGYYHGTVTLQMAYGSF